MADWPSSLKPIGKYMARAREVEVDEPIIAYYCSYYSLTKAIELRDKSDDSANRFVTGLLEKCETLKKALPPDDGTHRGIVEEFALRVFDRADNEDRADRATKATARTFYAAMCFLEVCSVFGPLPDDLAERLRYAKWKAADITKALREGRRPTPGAPGEAEAREKEEEAEEQARGDAVTSDAHVVPPAPPVQEYESAMDRAEDPYPPVAPKYPSSDAPSPLKSFEPQPPTLDIRALPLHAAPPQPPSLDLPAQPAPPSLHLPIPSTGRSAFDHDSLKSVNAKLQPYVPPADQVRQLAPSIAKHDPPASLKPKALLTEPVPPTAVQHDPPASKVPPALAIEPVPPPTDPVPLIHPPTRKPAVTQPVVSAVETKAPGAVGASYRPTIRQTQEAQRCAKYAASALDFQDVKAAIANLQQALDLLQGRR